MTRNELVKVLEAEGFLVRPWGTVGSRSSTFVIVRPGGVLSQRCLLEVWLVGPTIYAGTDPDEGMQEEAERLWAVLRKHLADVDVRPGPVYEPNRNAPHFTMVASGTGSVATLGG